MHEGNEKSECVDIERIRALGEHCNASLVPRLDEKPEIDTPILVVSLNPTPPYFQWINRPPKATSPD
jgi:hypothetical protein